MAPRYPGRSMMTASPGSTRQRASRSRPCCAPASTSTDLGGHAEALGDRFAQRRLPLGRTMPPRRVRVARQHLIDRLLERRRREAVDRRLTRRERQDACIRRVAERVAQRGVARSQRVRRYLAPPGEGRTGRIGSGADERAAPDVSAQQPARLELTVGADDGRAADAEADSPARAPVAGAIRKRRRRARSPPRAARPGDCTRASMCARNRVRSRESWSLPQSRILTQRARAQRSNHGMGGRRRQIRAEFRSFWDEWIGPMAQWTCAKPLPTSRRPERWPTERDPGALDAGRQASDPGDGLHVSISQCSRGPTPARSRSAAARLAPAAGAARGAPPPLARARRLRASRGPQALLIQRRSPNHPQSRRPECQTPD